MRFTIDIDPATLSTAQQRFVNFKLKIVVPNPRVVKAMRSIIQAVKYRVKEIRAEADRATEGGYGLLVAVQFLFAFPKGGTKAEKAARFDGQPVISAKWGDLDNRQKAFQDALVKAGAIPDDHLITALLLRKRYTIGRPRIVVGIGRDDGRTPILTREALEITGEA